MPGIGQISGHTAESFGRNWKLMFERRKRNLFMYGFLFYLLLIPPLKPAFNTVITVTASFTLSQQI